MIETIIYIIPSINVFSFLITFLINFNVTRFMIRKFKFSNIYNFDILIFEIPIIIFFLFNFLFFLSAQTSGNIHFFFLNCTIALSFLIFFEGFILFFEFFKKLKLNNHLKIIIIFLLFYFFRLCSISNIIFIRIYNEFKKNFYKRVKK